MNKNKNIGRKKNQQLIEESNNIKSEYRKSINLSETGIKISKLLKKLP
jgi:hypothetical protein